MDKKLQIAKQLLKDNQDEVEQFGEMLHGADKQFVGATLKEKEAQFTKWALEAQVYIEALQDYVDLIESQIKQGEENDADEAKVADLRNEANAMCEHTD
jgi:hypothetical protein